MLRQLAAIYIMISVYFMAALVVALACYEVLDLFVSTSGNVTQVLGLPDPKLPRWLGIIVMIWFVSSCLFLVKLDSVLGLTIKEFTMGKHVADTVFAFIFLALLWIPINNLWFSESPTGTRGDAFQWTSYVLLLLFVCLCAVFTKRALTGWRDKGLKQEGGKETMEAEKVSDTDASSRDTPAKDDDD